jgi:hypothetical protein
MAVKLRNSVFGFRTQNRPILRPKISKAKSLQVSPCEREIGTIKNGGKIEKFCVRNPNTEMANFTAKLSRDTGLQGSGVVKEQFPGWSWKGK